MPTTNSSIQFKHGLQEAFSSITKDSNTIYFITDTNRLFVGDSEYTRPVQHGSELPTSKNPANSLFVKETGTSRELYYSKDGTAWDMIAYLPATITGGVFGDNTAGTVAYGGTIKVPKVTVDNRGYVTAAEDVTLTLPASDKVTTVTSSGDGNAVTGGSISADGATLTLTKGESFVPASGGTFTGDVVVNGDLKTGSIAPMNGDRIDIQTVSTNNSPDRYFVSLRFKDNSDYGLCSPCIEGSCSYNISEDIEAASEIMLVADFIGLSGTVQASRNIVCQGTPSENNHLTNKLYVDNAIASALSASDAMVFKGTVGTSGTASSFSAINVSSATKGDTYKVITADTLPAASSFDSTTHTLTPGDLIVYMGESKFIYVPSGDEDVTSVKVAGSGDTINVSTTAQTGTVVLGDVATKKVSTSTTLNGNGASNDNVATELAVKTYVDDTNTKISVTATEPNPSKYSMVISNSSQQSNLTTTPASGNIILGAAASKDVLLAYGPGELTTDDYIPTAKAVSDLVNSEKQFTRICLFDVDDNDPDSINVSTTAQAGLIRLGNAAGVNTATSVTNDATTVPTTAAVKTYVDTLENSLGTAATTDATSYATAAQGTKADNAMPKSGGTFTGAVTLAGAPTTDLNAATKKYVDDTVAAATLTWKTF